MGFPTLNQRQRYLFIYLCTRAKRTRLSRGFHLACRRGKLSAVANGVITVIGCCFLANFDFVFEIRRES